MSVIPFPNEPPKKLPTTSGDSWPSIVEPVIEAFINIIPDDMTVAEGLEWLSEQNLKRLLQELLLDRTKDADEGGKGSESP